MLRSHKIRFTFYTKSTLRKLLCKPNDRESADESNIAYELHCSNYEAVYFSESKRSSKWPSDEYKRSVKNCEKNETVKHCWEADHNFSWDQRLPNLRQYLVTYHVTFADSS